MNEDKNSPKPRFSSPEIQFESLNQLFTYANSVNLIYPNPHPEPANLHNLESLKRTYEDFRQIFRRRSELKFEFACEKLLNDIIALKRTVVGIMNDQKRTLSGDTTLINSDLACTYLEYLPHLCRESKNLLISWIQIKLALISNKWLKMKLQQKLDVYETKCIHFFCISADICHYLRSIIELGTRLLCSLSSEQINQRFCDDFISALNDYNKHVYILNFYHNSDPHAKQISFQEFFTHMAYENGLILAKKLSVKVAKYCNSFSKLESHKSTKQTSLTTIYENETNQKSKQANFIETNETSDYYSSSASSSKTLPESTSVVNKRQLPRIPFASQSKFSKKLANFYTHFFQQKFMVFDSFVKSCQLWQGIDKIAIDKKKCFDEERKLMWKNCISITCNSFSTEIIRTTKLGLHGIPSLMQIDESSIFKLLDFMVDLLLVVPFPEELLPVKPLMQNLNKLILSTAWSSTIHSCLNHIYLDKNSMPFLNSTKLKEMMDLGKFSNENLHFVSRHLFQHFVYCKSLWAMSSYNMQILNALFNCYHKFFDNEESHYHVWLHTKLSNKTSSTTMTCLHETFPQKNVWNRIIADPVEASEYVPYLISTVLEPCNASLGDINDGSDFAIKEILIDQIFSAWLEFIRTKGIKLGPNAIKQLKLDFETAKIWVLKNLCLKQEEKDELETLNVFQKIDAVFHILSDDFSHQKRPASSIVLFNKGKVAPSIENENKESVVIKIVPEAVNWRKLRKSTSLNCMPCV